MTIALSELRVGAEFDSGKYVAGMRQKVDADRAGAASSREVGTAIGKTEIALKTSSNVLSRLEARYVDGAASAQRFNAAIKLLGRGIETDLVPMNQIDTILDGIYRKFGLTASASSLAEHGFLTLADRVAELNAKLAKAETAHSSAAAAAQRQAAAIQQITAAEKNLTPDARAGRAEDIAAYGAELDRLRAKYNPIFAASRQYETELNDLNRAHQLGAITAREQETALEALNARYLALAKSAQTARAATDIAARASRAASMQSRQLSFQLVDIGQALATAPTMGIYALQNLGFQVAQIGQLYAGQGGFNAALKDSIALIGRFASRIGRVAGPIGLVVGALFSIKHAAAEMTTSTVTFGDVFAGVMKAIRLRVDGVLKPIRERFGWVWDWIADKTKWLGNLVVNSFRAAASDVKFVFGNLPTIVEAAAIGSANALIRGLNFAIDKASQGMDWLIDKANKIPGVDLGKMRPLGAFSLIDNPAANDLAKANAEHRKQIERIKASDPLGDFFNDAVRFTVQSAEANDKGLAKQRKSYAELVRSARQFIAAQEMERTALGLTAEEALRLRHEQELLNKAANDNIRLTPAQTQELKALGAEMAHEETVTSKLRDALDFARSTAKGFMSDLRQGLESGKGFWRSFADAALGSLDKIVDKLETDVLATLLKVNQASASGGGGFWGSVLSIFGGAFGVGSGGGDFKDGGINAMLGIGANASGTDYWRGGPTWVGENGPEIINAPTGSQIIPNHRLVGANANMPAAANQNGVLEIRLGPGLEAEWLQKAGEKAVRVVRDAAPGIAAAGAQGGAQLAMNSLARGEADSTMSALYGVQRQTKVVG